MGTTRFADQPADRKDLSGDHTPGPWRANSSWIEGPQMALRVAAVDWPKRGTAPNNEAEAKANARLIAAAPDLLKACEDCMEGRGDWAAVMGDAIRKARGIA